MKKLKVLFICFVIMLCGIVFNSCSCSGEVYPTMITIKYGEGVSYDMEKNVYKVAVGDEVTFNYTLSPSDATFTAITVEIYGATENIELVGTSPFDNGASGSFKLKCKEVNAEDQVTIVRLYYGSESASRDLKISVIEPEQLDEVQNIRVDESYNLVWDSVENTTGYEVLVNDGVKDYQLFTTSATLEGATYSTGPNSSAVFEIKEGVIYSTKIKATNSAPEFEDSNESEEFKFCILPQPKVTVDNGEITFQKTELEKFSSVIKEFSMKVNANSVGFEETSLAYSVDSKNLDTIRDGKYSSASVIEVQLQTIAKTSTDNIKYYSSKINELPIIRRLNVEGLKLENGDYSNQGIDGYVESSLIWSDSNKDIDSNDFKYEIEVLNSSEETMFKSDDWNFSQVKISELFEQPAAGAYTIKISAVAKDDPQAVVNLKSKYINSEPVSKTFTVGALSSISANVDSNGLLKVVGFGEADFQTLSGVLFEINGNEYVYSSEFTNSEYYINLSNEIESNGNLVVNVYAIGRTTTDENFLGYVNAKVISEESVEKLNGVSEFKVNSNRTLTWSFAGECERFNIAISDSENNIIKEKFEIGFDGANLVESSGGINKYSLDFTETNLNVGVTYNFEIYVAQSGKISSSKTIIKNIQVKEAINKDQITAKFEISSKKNIINWGIDDSVSYSINGGVEQDTNEGNVTIDNITGQVSVGLKVVGVVNKFLDSSVTTKIFNRTEIENLTINDGKISLEEGNYFVEVTDSLNVWTIIVESNGDDILDLNSFQYDYINGSSQTGELEIEIGKDYVLTILKFDDDSFCSDYKSIKLRKYTTPVFEISKNGEEINYKFNKTVKYSINNGNEENFKTEDGFIKLNEYNSEIIAYAPASAEVALWTGVNGEGNAYYLRSDELKVVIEKLDAPEVELSENVLSWESSLIGQYLVNGKEENSNTFAIDVEQLTAGEHSYSIQALGNISSIPTKGTEFYIDSDITEKTVVKSEPIEAELTNGVVSWKTVKGEFKFEFNNDVIENAEIKQDGENSFVDLSNKVPGEDSEYTFKIAVKRDGEDFYSNYSELAIKFKNIEDIVIEDNNLFVTIDNSISSSCKITGLNDELEIKLEGGVANLYIEGVYSKELSPQNGLYGVDISEYVDYIDDNEVEITLAYSNINGYLNVSKTFNVEVLKLVAVVDEDGNIAISGASNIKTIITHNISEELTTNLKTLDFSISELIGVKEGEIKINSTPIIDEDSLVLYKGIEEQLFELAPAADLYSESGVLKFNFLNSEYVNYKYELFKDGVYNKDINTTNGEIAISTIEEIVPGTLKIKVVGKNASSVVANNRGSILNVDFLSAPASISVNPANKTLNWAYVGWASKYEIKLKTGSNNLGSVANNSFEILNDSAETEKLQNGVGTIGYEVVAIGNSVEAGNEKIAYLNNSNTSISIDVNVQNKYIDGAKIENGMLTWENSLTDAKFKVCVYDTDKSFVKAKETYGTTFDVSSLIDSEYDYVYLCSVELIHAENTVLYKDDNQTYAKFIWLDSNNSNVFKGAELKDGLISCKMDEQVLGFGSLIDAYNSVEPTDKQIGKDLAFPETIFELFIALSSSDNPVFSFFKNIKLLVNGVSYDFEVQIDTEAILDEYPALKNLNYKNVSVEELLGSYRDLTDVNNNMKELPIYVQLDERFDEGSYTVQMGYKPVEGLDIVTKGYNENKITGIKPSSPFCPTNPADGYSAFKNDGSGTLIFNYSYINGAIVKDYYISITNESGDVIKFVKYSFPDDYEFNLTNQTAEINLNELFFKENEEELEYNVVYGIKIATVGSNEYFMSNSSGLPNCFGKLKALNAFNINDGLIEFNDVCEGLAIDYVGGYTLLLTDEYGNDQNYRYNNLDSEMFLEGLSYGKYNAKFVLNGDGYGIIDSEPISFGYNEESPDSPEFNGDIYKLVSPQAINLNNGMFSWKTVNSDGSGAEVKYLYRFVVQKGVEPEIEETIEEAWRKEYSIVEVDGEKYVVAELSDEYEDVEAQYKIQVVSYVEGENYFVRSNIVESEFYMRKNAPTSIALSESGMLSWVVGDEESVTYSFVYDNEDANDQIVLKENYVSKFIDINGDSTSNISNLINKDGSTKVLDFILFNEGGDSYLNSVKKVFELKTLPNLTAVSIDNNGRIILAESDSVYLVDGSLQSDKYLVGINGEFEINGKVEEANLLVYLPNTHKNYLEVNEFKNTKLTATGSPNTYTYGGDESGEFNIKVKPGNSYIITLRYVGFSGELQDAISNVSTNMVSRSAVKVLPTMSAPIIVGLDELGDNEELSQTSSYIKFELVDDVKKYLLNVNNENNIEINLSGEAGNITVSSSNLQDVNGYTLNDATSKTIDGCLFADISEMVEHYRIKEENFNLSVKAIGNENIGLTCNEFSESCEVIIPSTPTNLNYNIDNAEISWSSESKTKFKIEIIYGVKNTSTDFVQENHYDNISRESNILVESPTSNYTYYKDIIKISEDVAEYENQGALTSVKYYLCYMCDEIKSIKVAGLSEDEIITSSFAEVSLQAGSKNKTFAGGDGSLESPFKISSGTEFARIENHKDKNFKLIKDFSVSGIYISEFDGTIDGENRTLTIENYRRVEIVANNQVRYAISLIGTNEGELKNINVDVALSSNISVDNSENKIDRISFVVLQNNGKLNNVKISGTEFEINDGRDGSALEVGVVAYSNNGEISNVLNNLEVNAYGEKSRVYVGGVVYSNSGTIYQCGNNAKLAGYGIGGVTYLMNKGSISESYNKGVLVANSVNKIQDQTRRIGGLVAWLNLSGGASISYSYVDLNVVKSVAEARVDELSGFIAKISNGSSNAVKLECCYVNVENIANDIISGNNLYLFVSSDSNLTINMLGFNNYNSNLNFWDDLSEQNRPEAMASWIGRDEIKDVFTNSQNKIVLQWENIA